MIDDVKHQIIAAEGAEEADRVESIRYICENMILSKRENGEKKKERKGGAGRWLGGRKPIVQKRRSEVFRHVHAPPKVTQASCFPPGMPLVACAHARRRPVAPAGRDKNAHCSATSGTPDEKQLA